MVILLFQNLLKPCREIKKHQILKIKRLKVQRTGLRESDARIGDKNDDNDCSREKKYIFW
jgi:hypothetical protein